MTDKVTLANVNNLIDATTAVTTINNNSAAIVAAMDNTLSLNGFQPNQMEANLDMNSNRILNLPTPATTLEPARLADLEVLTGGGTITINPLPTGGITGQSLTKNSNTNFDAGWNTLTNVVPTGGTSNQVLTKNSSTNFDSSWENLPTAGTITSVTAGTGLTGGGSSGGVTLSQTYTGNAVQIGNASFGSPTGTVNTAGVFMGLGSNAVIIPTTSGRMKVEFLGVGTGTGGSAALITVRFGTGTAPTNGTITGGTGTQIGGSISIAGTGVTTLSCPFANGGIITGLTVGTHYWVDISLSTSNASNAASIVLLSFNAFEF